jgi:hypothetical protein
MMDRGGDCVLEKGTGACRIPPQSTLGYTLGTVTPDPHLPGFDSHLSDYDSPPVSR